MIIVVRNPRYVNTIQTQAIFMYKNHRQGINGQITQCVYFLSSRSFICTDHTNACFIKICKSFSMKLSIDNYS